MGRCLSEDVHSVSTCAVLPIPASFLKKIIYFYLFILATLGFHCCTLAFSSCGERGLLFVEVHGLLIAVASLVAEHGL